jgi:hypothetical protein
VASNCFEGTHNMLSFGLGLQLLLGPAGATRDLGIQHRPDRREEFNRLLGASICEDDPRFNRLLATFTCGVDPSKELNRLLATFTRLLGASAFVESIHDDPSPNRWLLI